MTFLERFKFYLIGTILGILLVSVLFGKKLSEGFSFFPNARVLEDLKNTKTLLSAKAQEQANTFSIDTTYIRNILYTSGEIKFSDSKPRQLPCPSYFIEDNKYIFSVTRCKKETTIDSISTK